MLFHLKLPVAMFTELRFKSIPLLVISPAFPMIEGYPVNGFNSIWPIRFSVFFLYMSNVPLNLFFKTLKSSPRFRFFVVSQVNVLLAGVVNVSPVPPG
ncbi:hypothetical protein D3C72_1531060 [compost metagenome]